jgi:hypothetical protein
MLLRLTLNTGFLSLKIPPQVSLCELRDAPDAMRHCIHSDTYTPGFQIAPMIDVVFV